MPIKLNKQLKGLTLVELLVTLALTSIVITLSYSGLNYVQKLYLNYKHQNQFLNSFTQFTQRMNYEALRAKTITEVSESEFLIQRDSVAINLKLLPKTIITTKNGVVDTFYMEAKKLVRTYQTIDNPAYTAKLIQSLNFECEFTKQKFIFYFYKSYDASTLLELEETN